MDEKFGPENDVFFSYLSGLSGIDVKIEDIISNFPSFVGHVNLARFLSISDAYRRVADLSGDVADVGTYKGASFFTFAKLVKLFEPYSNTTVHGFDWFKGQNPGPNDNAVNLGKYSSSKEDLLSLISKQGLEGLMKLHDINLVDDFRPFLKERPWLRFKVAFVDIGIESVLEAVLPDLWERMVPGGCLIVDHFNHEASPMESSILMSTIKDALIEQARYSRSPTGFIFKPSAG